MQVIRLQRDDWNFFCPATGRPVFTASGEPNTPSFCGSWHHEVPEGPLALADDLLPLWRGHLRSRQAAGEPIDVPAFLDSVTLPGWVAFEISSLGKAGGPVWSTVWIVLDLS